MKESDKVEKIIESLYKKIKKSYERGNLKDRLLLVKMYANIMYSYNQKYIDLEIEKMLYNTINLTFQRSTLKVDELYENKVVFYDVFGFDNRGLAQIYLKALCKKYDVVYITPISNKNRINNIKLLLEKNGGKIYYLSERNIKKSIYELFEIINKVKPKNMFLYTRPYDIVGISVFQLFENIINRYQINLTDHAFWLGIKSFDYCIEFRDYGASISYKYRNIEKNKLIKLPFYPNIDYNKKFEGYPFEFDEKKDKVIFSGGHLYKTLGEGNKYYKIVENLLVKYPDLFFWYAGSGDSSEIDKLIKKFPDRVSHTDEREDLYQILKKCYFYLSTYPICGGLMFQYAAKANKLPITLKYDDITNDFLINQEKLNIIFNSEEELYNEIEKLYNDDEYKKEKEKNVGNSVITEENFEKNLYQLLQSHKTNFDIIYKNIDTKDFLETYKENVKIKEIYRTFFYHCKFKLLFQLPIITLYGFILAVNTKIKKYLKIFN